MSNLDWLESKRQEVEADFKIGRISEEKYHQMIAAIESKKKKKSKVESFKLSVKTLKQLHWNSEKLKNVQEWYDKWLISKAEYNQYVRMNHPLIKKKKTSFFSYIILWIWVLLFLYYWFFYMPRKSYIKVDNFAEMWDPTQVPTSWSITRVVEWQTITINYLADYIISWRVVATAQYWSNLIEKLLWSWALTDNEIRYRDVWIWWWFMTQDEYVDKITFDSLSRFLYPKVESQKDWEFISQKYTWDDIGTHFSHNHLIPFDNHVKKLLRWIKKWQYVQIKWYLVALHWDRWYELTSSLVRDDTWDWACETILVTDVVWLKEK